MKPGVDVSLFGVGGVFLGDMFGDQTASGFLLCFRQAYTLTTTETSILNFVIHLPLSLAIFCTSKAQEARRLMLGVAGLSLAMETRLGCIGSTCSARGWGVGSGAEFEVHPSSWAPSGICNVSPSQWCFKMGQLLGCLCIFWEEAHSSTMGRADDEANAPFFVEYQ